MKIKWAWCRQPTTDKSSSLDVLDEIFKRLSWSSQALMGFLGGIATTFFACTIHIGK
jgi:hypothetical protein